MATASGFVLLVLFCYTVRYIYIVMVHGHVMFVTACMAGMAVSYSHLQSDYGNHSRLLTLWLAMIGIRHVLDGCVACDQKMIILRAQNLRFGELSQVQSQQPTGIQSAPQQIMVRAGTFLSRGQFFASNRGMTPCAVVFIWYRGFTNGSPPPSFAENSTSYNSCVLKLSRYQSQAR